MVNVRLAVFSLCANETGKIHQSRKYGKETRHAETKIYFKVSFKTAFI